MYENLLKFRDIIDQNFLFWFCALLGSGVFFLQLLLSLFGVGEEESLEMDGLKIQWLSKQAISGFLMLFGWSALTCYHQFNFSSALTWSIALGAGVVTVLINGYIFKAVRRLHSPGDVFRLEDTLGKEAIVYQRIPENGVGKISVSLHNLTYEIDAISLTGEELPSFTSVRIVKQANENTVIVQ